MARQVRHKHFIGISAISALIVMGWWAQQEEDFSRALEKVDGKVPDYYLKGFTVTVMDDAGKPAHRLEAGRLNHYAEDDIADVIQPVLHAYRDDGRTWVMQSEVAKAYDGGSYLWLEGDVNLHRQATDVRPRLDMDTRDLWVYPEREYAESAEAVMINNGVSTTQGVGVRVDLASGHMNLLSAVRGHYVFENR